MNLERRFTRQVLRVFVLAALLLPCWQMSTVGQETLKNILPWKSQGYKSGECGDGVNKTFPYCGLNNTGYVDKADANGGYGMRVERGGNKDDKEKKPWFISSSTHSAQCLHTPGK